MAIADLPVEGDVFTQQGSCTGRRDSTLLVGMVLALIYFSPAAEWFQNKELTHDG